MCRQLSRRSGKAWRKCRGSPGPHPRCLFPDGGDVWRAITADLMHDPAMTGLCMNGIGAPRYSLRTRAELALENLALRQRPMRSSARWPKPALRGERQEFTVNCSNSASISASAASPASCHPRHASLPRRPGAPFSTTLSVPSPRSTSSPCPPQLFASSTSFSSSPTTATCFALECHQRPRRALDSPADR
jgi:hypothetical protein